MIEPRVEENYYTRHELPRRLLDVGHVTCFRVRDWVTRVIRGAGRQFCQRRVDHTHSRPATVNGHSRQSLSLTGYPLEILDGTQWRANSS